MVLYQAVFEDHDEKALGVTRREVDEMMAACDVKPELEYCRINGYEAPGYLRKVSNKNKERILGNLKTIAAILSEQPSHPLTPLFRMFDVQGTIGYFSQYPLMLPRLD